MQTGTAAPRTYGGHYLTSAELRSLGCRRVGENVLVHSTCVLVGMETLEIGGNVRVDAFCTLIAVGGHIILGSHVHISAYAFLSGGAGITVGDFVGISQRVCVYTSNDDYTGGALTGPTIPAKYLNLTRGQVLLRDHVVIGAGSIVLPSLTVGEGTTVGSLSLVKTSLEPWSIYAGVPARRLRARSRALLGMRAQLHAETTGPDVFSSAP